MLKDFAKLETFLTVVKERSFSKASKKLGISQPAVTQQIKWLEDYLDNRIVDRKKNGITLTKTGEDLYKVAQRLDRCVTNVERDIIKIINKELTFVIGASFTIGNYVLPYCLNDLQKAIDNEVLISVDTSDNVLNQLLEKKIDLALVEAPVLVDGVIHKQWLEDELVLFSNTKLPKQIKPENLQNYNWVCREEGSHTRKLATEVFSRMDIECKNFNIVTTVTSQTAVRNTVINAKEDDEQPTLALLSKFVIDEDLSKGSLHMAHVKGLKFKRHFSVVYLKERKYDAFIAKVSDFIMSRSRKA
jgi:DNA-binding transcriptional LysR family regulator